MSMSAIPFEGYYNQTHTIEYDNKTKLIPMVIPCYKEYNKENIKEQIQKILYKRGVEH